MSRRLGSFLSSVTSVARSEDLPPRSRARVILHPVLARGTRKGRACARRDEMAVSALDASWQNLKTKELKDPLEKVQEILDQNR